LRLEAIRQIRILHARERVGNLGHIEEKLERLDAVDEQRSVARGRNVTLGCLVERLPNHGTVDAFDAVLPASDFRIEGGRLVEVELLCTLDVQGVERCGSVGIEKAKASPDAFDLQAVCQLIV